MSHEGNVIIIQFLVPQIVYPMTAWAVYQGCSFLLSSHRSCVQQSWNGRYDLLCNVHHQRSGSPREESYPRKKRSTDPTLHRRLVHCLAKEKKGPPGSWRTNNPGFLNSRQILVTDLLFLYFLINRGSVPWIGNECWTLLLLLVSSAFMKRGLKSWLALSFLSSFNSQLSSLDWWCDDPSFTMERSLLPVSCLLFHREVDIVLWRERERAVNQRRDRRDKAIDSWRLVWITLVFSKEWPLVLGLNAWAFHLHLQTLTHALSRHLMN